MGPLGRAALVALLVAAGCGSQAAAPAEPRYDLTITFWPTGRGGEPRSATLTCEPAGGTHPDPAKACEALLAHMDALDPVPPGVACTQVYGGAQVASISGSGLDATFSRTNGCGIGRWDALAPVLEIGD